MWENICSGEKKNLGNVYLEKKAKSIASIKKINICKIFL